MNRSFFATLFALAFAATNASAQDANQASATLLFDDAQKLMDAGQVGEACEKFAESQRLDPQLGTLLYLADCLEQSGRTASAWSGFRAAAELAQKRGDERQQVAEERAAALEQRLSKLRIEPPPGVDLRVVRIERDGVEISSALWGTEVPVDPGEHTVVVSAEGRHSWKGQVTIAADGAVTVVEVPALAVEKEPAAAPTPIAKSSAPASVFEGRLPAVAALAVGVGGVALGSFFGLRSLGQKNDADEHCDGRACRTQRGVELRDDAIASGNVSTIGFVVGGVGLALGTTLWFALGPSESEEQRPSAGSREPRLRAGVGMDGIVLEQAW